MRSPGGGGGSWALPVFPLPSPPPPPPGSLDATSRAAPTAGGQPTFASTSGHCPPRCSPLSSLWVSGAPPSVEAAPAPRLSCLFSRNVKFSREGLSCSWTYTYANPSASPSCPGQSPGGARKGTHCPRPFSPGPPVLTAWLSESDDDHRACPPAPPTGALAFPRPWPGPTALQGCGHPSQHPTSSTGTS